MKNYLLLLLALISFRANVLAQESNNQAQVLQLIVNIPELKELYSEDQICIMQHGIEFDTSVEVFNNETKVEFHDKNSINSLNIPEFFLFYQFFIGEEEAKVIGQYIKNYNSATENSTQFEILFTKHDADWTNADYQLNFKNN